MISRGSSRGDPFVADDKSDILLLDNDERDVLSVATDDESLITMDSTRKKKKRRKKRRSTNNLGDESTINTNATSMNGDESTNFTDGDDNDYDSDDDDKSFRTNTTATTNATNYEFLDDVSVGDESTRKSQKRKKKKKKKKKTPIFEGDESMDSGLESSTDSLTTINTKASGMVSIQSMYSDEETGAEDER